MALKMKYIYETILAKLKEIPELKWIDLDKGQLEFYEGRPSVAFPCALIEVQYPKTTDMDQMAKVQDADVLVSVRVAHDFAGINTSGAASDAHRAASLTYLDTVEKVYLKLQGFSDAVMTPLSRQNVRAEKRADGIKVNPLNFVTSFVDKSADA